MNISKQGSINVGLMALLPFFTTFSFADQSQASSSTACAQCENPRDNFPAAFDFAQLESPRTPQELLQLIRVISENFLLLDPRFQQDDFLKRLFDSSTLTDPYAAYPSNRERHHKDTKSAENSLFRKEFKIDGVAVSFAKFNDEYPARSYGQISFITAVINNPFSADLVMNELGKEAKWLDPLLESNPFSITENADHFLRRPRSTDPRGYFQTEFIHQNSKVISKLSVALNQNGTLRLIVINQQDKRK